MSSLSSLADASSGAGEDLSFTTGATNRNGREPDWNSSANQSTAQNTFVAQDDTLHSHAMPNSIPAPALRHQLFLKVAEAKRWQDSVLHLSGIATGKEEALAWERSHNLQLTAALERVEAVATARQLEIERMCQEQRESLQQVATLQSEVQAILETCSKLEAHVAELGLINQIPSSTLS